MLRRMLKFSLISMLLLLVGAAAWIYYIVQASVPNLDGEVRHASLSAPVEVIRDDWGVPHIAASSETDAYFALGYCMAQDRLFQMELFRRLARGELAEILGPPLVEVDKAIRLFRLRAKAEQFFARDQDQMPELKALAEAFCAGINHFRTTGPRPWESRLLAIPDTPFTPVDCLAVAAILPITFSYGPRQDPLFTILQERYPDTDMNLLFPGYAQQQAPATVMETLEEASTFKALKTVPEPELGNSTPITAAPAAPSSHEAVMAYVSQIQEIVSALGIHMGSNSWVVAPELTETGGAILANDPHIGFTNPSIWYEAHVTYGDYDNYGYHLPLIPIPLLGHNEDRGWGLTMFANDDVDVYQEELNPEDPSLVRYRGEWKKVTEEQERIRVRFAEDLTHTIRLTDHGPLVTDLLEKFEGYQGPPAALFWVWQHVPYTDLEAFYRMSHARDYEAFAQALRLVTSPGVNVSYADRHGNIAWWAAGLLPVRPDHVNPKRMLDGASGRDEILGFVPFEQNPQLMNPKAGFIATANNKSTVKPVGPIKELPGYWQPDDRAARIEQVLQAGPEGWLGEHVRNERMNCEDALQEMHLKWDLEDFQALQMDDVSMHPELLSELLALVQDSGTFAGRTELLEQLRNWDGSFRQDSIPAAVYSYLCDALLHVMLSDDLDAMQLSVYGTLGDSWNFLKYAALDENSPFWDDRNTSEHESRAQMVERAFEMVFERIETDLGPNVDQWRWGRVHTMTYKHPFGYLPLVGRLVNIGPFEASGSAEVINNMLFPRGQFKYDIVAGPSTRRLIDFSRPELSYTILPTGNSGHVASPHYDDQAEMFINGEYREVRFTREQIERNARHTLHLLPG